MCNRFVSIVIRLDKKRLFRYASIQSDFAQEMLPNYGINPNTLYSLFLIQNGKIFEKSNAVLRVFVTLKGIWILTYILYIIPKFIRDTFYDIIAKNRYLFTGIKNNCDINAKESELIIR